MAVAENITGKVTKAQFLEHAVDINAKETPAGAQAKADAAKTAAEASARAAYATQVVVAGKESRIYRLGDALPSPIPTGTLRLVEIQTDVVEATAPGQVTGLSATPATGQITLAWSAPTSGGSPITDYIVQFRTGANAFAPFADPTSTATTAVVTGLTDGTAYDFRVAAVNTIGTGAFSATATATPAAAATVPGAPTIGTATASAGQASVAFTPPASNGGSTITSYTARSTPGNITGTGSTSPVTVNGLTNGLAYTFTVTATNAAGTSVESAASNSVTPAAAASAEVVESFGAPGDAFNAILGVDQTWTELDNWNMTDGYAFNNALTSAITARCEAPVSSSNHYFEVDALAPVGDVPRLGVMGRYQPVADSGYFFWARPNATSTYRLGKMTSGTPSTLTTINTATLPTFPCVLRIECNGSTIRGLVNGVEVITFTDTSYPTGTRGGLYAEGPVANADLKITAFRGSAL